jgi:Zn-finger protein
MLKDNNRSIAKRGDKNPMWRGNRVGYTAVHEWVSIRMTKPKICPVCNKKPVYDLTNVSGKYKRDLSDWIWLCRRCHMIKDGRMKKLLIMDENRMLYTKTR